MSKIIVLLKLTFILSFGSVMAADTCEFSENANGTNEEDCGLKDCVTVENEIISTHYTQSYKTLDNSFGRMILDFNRKHFGGSYTPWLGMSPGIILNGKGFSEYLNIICTEYASIMVTHGRGNTVESLIAKGFKITSIPKSKDVIIYVNDDFSFTHIGIIDHIANGQVYVNSKWGHSSLVVHREDVVPYEYGNKIMYLRSPEHRHTEKLLSYISKTASCHYTLDTLKQALEGLHSSEEIIREAAVLLLKTLIDCEYEIQELTHSVIAVVKNQSKDIVESGFTILEYLLQKKMRQNEIYDLAYELLSSTTLEKRLGSIKLFRILKQENSSVKNILVSIFMKHFSTSDHSIDAQMFDHIHILDINDYLEITDIVDIIQELLQSKSNFVRQRAFELLCRLSATMDCSTSKDIFNKILVLADSGVESKGIYWCVEKCRTSL